MGRLPKVGAEFFPHVTHHGQTIFALERKWGNDGYAFWFKLLEALSAVPEHTMLADGDSLWTVFVERCLTTDEQAREMLDTLARLDAIDRELWETSRVIWCQNLVNHFANLYQKRHKALPGRPTPVQRRAISVTESAAADDIRHGNDEPVPRLAISGVKSAHRGEERRGEEHTQRGGESRGEEVVRAPVPEFGDEGPAPDPPPLPRHQLLAVAWYRRYSRETGQLVAPSEQDNLKALELCKRMDPDLAESKIEPYFTRDYWFNSVKGKPGRVYAFGRWAANILEITANGKPAARGWDCPHCHARNTHTGAMCMHCHEDRTELPEANA